MYALTACFVHVLHVHVQYSQYSTCMYMYQELLLFCRSSNKLYIGAPTSKTFYMQELHVSAIFQE